MADDAQIETLLRRKTRFTRLWHVPSCTSTQDLAAADPRDDDLVIWADHQTAGRGRQQREWHDEPDADLAVTFRTTATLAEPTTLPAAVPVAVLQGLEPFAGRALAIKWPNDLLLDGRKLCGVLIDRGVGAPDRCLIGIGINVNRTRFPPDLEARATSLALATGLQTDRGALLLALAERLDAALGALATGRLGEFEVLFRDRLGMLGALVEADAVNPYRGKLTALDFRTLELDGRLRLPLATVRGLRLARP